MASFHGTLPRDSEKLRREIQARNGGPTRTRHERGIPGSAGNVEDPLSATDVRAPNHMVGDCLDALGDPIVVPGCPHCPVSLLQLSQVWPVGHDRPRPRAHPSRGAAPSSDWGA